MDLTQRVDAAIDRAIAEKRIVGTATMAARHGEIIYSRAAGLMNREKRQPVAIDTIFRYASLTKPIVAATILAMRDQGLLDLDDPITRFLPYFEPKLPGGAQPDITVHHLLTHTAGTTPDISATETEKGEPRFVAVNGEFRLLPLEDNMKRLAERPLLHEPGSCWQYGLGLDVLGAVAARLAGGTLGDAVAKYVTGPLGMKDTLFSVSDAKRLAVPYADAEDGEPVIMGEPHAVPNKKHGGITVFSPDRINDPRAFHSGGGGMAGTAPDFLKFLIALEGGGEPILKRETVADATRNQIGGIELGPADKGKKFGYFGAVVADPEVARTPQTKGTYLWGGVFGNTWFIDPAEGLAVVSLTNTALEGCNGAFPDELRDAIYG